MAIMFQIYVYNMCLKLLWFEVIQYMNIDIVKIMQVLHKHAIALS